MFSLRNKKNDLRIILNTSSYLGLCYVMIGEINMYLYNIYLMAQKGKKQML